MAGVSVVISARDNATGVIDRVNTGLQNLNRRAAAARAPIDRMSASLGRFGQITGVDRIASDMGGLAQKIGGAAASLGKFAPALGATTGRASTAGTAELVNRWTAFGSRLGLDSQRIGITAAGLHGLQGAARLAGSSAEALTSGMQTLGDNLTNAVAGRAPETVAMMDALKLSWRDTATGGARLAKDVLPEIADKISKIESPTLRALAATTLLGSAGESLMPLMMRGAGGLRDYAAEAEKYGLTKYQGVQAAQALREEQTRLALAIEGVGNSVSESVAPLLVPMLRQLSDWVRDNRGEVASFFHTIAKAMKSWVEDDGGLAKLIESLKAVYDTLARIVGIADSVGHGLRKAWDSGAALPQVDEYGRPVQPAAPATGLPPPPATVPTVPGQDSRSWWQRLLPTGFGGRPAALPAVPLPQGEQAARARAAYDRYVGQGDSPEAAAGRVANLIAESGMNERSVGDGGQAYGLGRHHADRRRAFRDMFGHDMEQGTREEQLDFFRRDPDSGAQEANRRLSRPGISAYEAASMVSRFNERPAD